MEAREAYNALYDALRLSDFEQGTEVMVRNSATTTLSRITGIRRLELDGGLEVVVIDFTPEVK